MTTTTTTEQPIFMNRKAVVALVGLCYTSIYNLEKLGKFPARRQISRGRVAWVRSEVISWAEGIDCAVPDNQPEIHYPIEKTSQPRKINQGNTCPEKPTATTHSRFEPWPWLRSS